MAIVHDSSSLGPAGLLGDDGNGNIPASNSANFNPPANSWIFVSLDFNDGNSGGVSPTVSNSGTVLTWSLVITHDDGNNTTFIYRAFNANAQTGIHVIIAGTDGNSTTLPATIGSFYVDVWTGANSSQVLAASAFTGTNTATSNPTVTTTASGSQVASIGVGGATAYTSSDVIATNGQASSRVYKAANSGAAGPVSCNYVTTGTNTQNFLVYEILAPAGGAAGPPLMGQVWT